ncbi:MAG: 3-phosphoglycerate dehydrogenase [Nitrososphaerota archaeon]|nr:3-phosphoglycerate dehydrogenase [Nitrososphaerota archaeon]MDG6927365.1 3-phosphoglycerate dehydrogenase [Nitrososphaerota archaeon]MDG6930907.1 3-phosphoglycerate dehydrogenase [Nitrososphaerota archaeon]MDG6932207.1 3-phosphoglycerate dehydrogenase [Nitrososphaerota archaeon]MDG6935800.1 3-phosphoglycerate dehydrogenase [Nitrososphaerota archaeon]
MKIISLDPVPEGCRKYVKYEGLNENDLKSAEVLLAWPWQIKDISLKSMTGLRAIQTFSAGVDGVDFSSIPDNVKVFSNAGAFSLPVAEQAWGLAIALAKGINLRKKVETYQITDRNVLILGAGGIGSEIARIAKHGFNDTVTGLSRSFKEQKNFDRALPMSYLDNEIGESDYIFDALPLNRSTEGILNYSVLKRLKKNAVIVNVGRGETVIEDDIYRTLVERHDVRFGTDVFWRKDGVEVFDTKLWQLENFTGTLHTGGAYGNEYALNRAKEIACKNALRFVEGLLAENEVKREDYQI